MEIAGAGDMDGRPKRVSEWKIPESISAAMLVRVCSPSIAAINHAS